MRIAYTNLVDSAALSASSENVIYPVENVQNGRLAKPWRTTSTTGVNCIVDLGAATAVSTVAIMGHTLTTSATLTIEANSADSWAAPAWSTTLTSLSGVILKYLDAAQTYRYWRFTMEDASSGSAYIDIGRLWLSSYLQVDPSSITEFTVGKERSDTVTVGRGKQKFATEGVGWRTFDLRFKVHSGTMLTAIQTLYDTVGNHESIIFSHFDSIRTYPIVEPVYCSIDGGIDFSHRRSMKFDYALKLTEDR